MDERLRQYRLDKDLYPRYTYAAEEIKRAYKKYVRLTSACGLSSEPYMPMFGDVLVNILESHVDLLLEADELSPIAMPDVSKFETMTHEQAEKQFAFPPKKENLPTIYVTKYTENNVPKDYFGNMIVYITGGDIPESKWSWSNDTYICVSNRKLCADDISEMLERYVFSFMRYRTELLNCIAQSAESDDYTEKLGRCLENKNKFSPSTPEKVGTLTLRQRKTHKANQLVLDSLAEDVDLQEHLKLAKSARPRLLDAVSEICTMYKRGEIPDRECPQIQERKKNITEEVVLELTNKIPQILGVGYRLDTLVLTLDSSIMKDELAMDKIKLETKKVFKSKNIEENNIHFIFSKRLMNKFACAEAETGSCIRAAGNGTLGGFVTKGTPPDKTCCLISANHVLQDELYTDVFLISPNGTETKIATMLQPIPDVQFLKPVDIAAAVLDIQPAKEPSLLDSAGKPVFSRVYDYQNQDQVKLLNGRKVHLWSANTLLRKGKITTPEYYRKGDTKNLQKLIGLENLDSDEASGDETTADVDGSRIVFATKGDSGSLVCADTRYRTYVDAIGMLFGEESISDDSVHLRKASDAGTTSSGEQGVNREREETLYERTASEHNRSSTVDSATQSKSEASASSCGTRRSRPLYLAFDLQSGLRHMKEKYTDDFQLCKSVNNP